MTTPTSGTISATDIINEFGNSNSNGGMSLGAYRQHKLANGNLTNYPQTVNGISFSKLDVGVPVSGQIKYSDMRNKKLNFVVDYNSFSQDRQNSVSHVNMQVRWQQGNNATVGGFKSAPTSSGDWNGGKKVFIHVNKTFGSITDNNRNIVALRTGQNWPDNTEMVIEVGGSGKIFGAGGRGGHGSNGSGTGGNAENGNSALGIDITTNSGGKSCTVIVRPGGYIQCGFEGGGGGGGFYDDPNKSSQDPVISGGGGGGGAGRPIGVGGNAGTGSQHGPNGDAGTNATNTVRGLGGSGKNGSQGSSRSGDGGNGAQSGADSENGDNATQGSSDNPKTFSAGGNKGLRGAAIRKRDASCGYTLSIDSGGQVVGDGNPANSAPTGVN